MASPIHDYALIGDCETAALVSRDGSIDWLCLPRFDSGAVFAALLGTPDHGRWRLAPVGETKTTRKYRRDTLVLETEHATEGGVVQVVDCMPIRTKTPDLVRVVTGVRGQVKMRMDLTIRPDYGSIIPWVRATADGIWGIAGPDSLRFSSTVAMRGEGMSTIAEFTVSEGEQIPFTLAWHPAHEHPPRPIDAIEAVASTERFWRTWARRCTYDGEYRDLVVRSLITLKALSDARTGGIVAAPTTSLPEHLGGVRNWDYRYCWVRDATFTLYALVNAGYREEARAWREWLLRACAGEPSKLQIMYGVAGERRLTEIELDWLPGYAGSRPVRVGNDAHRQLQLDVYGEVCDALYQCKRVGIEGSDETWKMQRALIEYLESAWDQPDDGIWEVRGPRRPFTHSRVMAWVAFDRAVKMAQSTGVEAPIARWSKARDAVFEQVCREGYDAQLGSFVQYYGSKRLDASLLMIPLVGFLPASDARVQGTLRAIERDLLQDGFVRRYDPDPEVEALDGDEGAFLPCSFWLCDNLVLAGRRDEARALFERLIAVCNDVGLLSEEYDPKTKRLLGNFPQAFSHVSLVNAATNLADHAGPAHHRGGAR